MTSWDPDLYLGFDDHRSRPFKDLLARIGADVPRHVVDLGCGPGHLTGLLGARWPAARISALDSSAEMVAAAHERGIAAEQADAVDWTPSADTDVVICNAVLQWVPEHLRLLPTWIAAMPSDGWFAFQVPGNFGAPSHQLVRELLDEPQWRGRVTLRVGDAVPEPESYAELIAATSADVDVWETTYLHRLTGADPVLSWISATALRPARDALGSDYDQFRDQLAPRLRDAYPQLADGTTWFPFRRIFAVAHTR